MTEIPPYIPESHHECSPSAISILSDFYTICQVKSLWFQGVHAATEFEDIIIL